MNKTKYRKDSLALAISRLKTMFVFRRLRGRTKSTALDSFIIRMESTSNKLLFFFLGLLHPGLIPNGNDLATSLHYYIEGFRCKSENLFYSTPGFFCFLSRFFFVAGLLSNGVVAYLV